jgi:hypothetical protein
MLPRAITAALQIPKLEAAEFTATKFDTAEDKIKFGNHLLRFIAEDFPRALWTKAFYNRLSMIFSNIAHYDSNGFWDTWFTTTTDQIQFLQNIVRHPCWGDPAFTYSDVEKVVRSCVKRSGIIAWKHRILADESKKKDVAELARLKAIYEPDTAPLSDVPPAVLNFTMTQTDLFS